MYAVIKTGGKQYKVAVGDKIKVELIPADIGSTITLSDVLMIAKENDVIVGSPIVDGASVTASVVSEGRHKKIRIFKMRRRKHYQKHQGHRQYYTEIQIDAINQ
jgi:large subunit ribosomal protein L21